MRKINTKIKAILVACAMACSGSVLADHFYKRIVDNKYMEKLCFSYVSSVDNEWKQALNIAVNSYNNALGNVANINFCDHYPWDASFVVEISMENLGYEIGNYAEADFPSFWGKRPGQTIKINADRVIELTDVELKAGLLMHEIGHIIGLHHTESYDGTKIPGTENDPNSINSLFIGSEINSNFNLPEFTEKDIYAIKYMYPKK